MEKPKPVNEADAKYMEEQIDFYTDENKWLEEQRVKAEQGLEAAETDEDREKYQTTLEKIGKYMTRNSAWIAYFRGEGEAPIRVESAEATDIEAEDLDSDDEKQKSVRVESTDPLTGQAIVGRGATEEEAIRDANNQMNDIRDGRR